MKKLILLLPLLISCSQSISEKERISVGNGGEVIPWDHGAAVLVGDDSFVACVKRDEKFEVSLNDSVDAIRRAQSTWKSYIFQTGLERRIRRESGGGSLREEGLFGNLERDRGIPCSAHYEKRLSGLDLIDRCPKKRTRESIIHLLS